MKTVKVSITDAMYEAAVHEAKKRGHATPSNPGVAGLMRGSLRYWLNKSGHTIEDLDRPDRRTR